MSTLSRALRAAADLVDAAPADLEQPSVSTEDGGRVVALQFETGSVAAVEAWGALLADTRPGTIDGYGYRQIEGAYHDVGFDLWALAPDYILPED